MSTTDPTTDPDRSESSLIELQSRFRLLPDDIGRIWRESEERQRAMTALVEALDGSDAVRLNTAIRRIDNAIVAGLASRELPRGPIQGVEIERATTMWAGRKDPDCRLLLSAEAIRRNLRLGRPDAVFRRMGDSSPAASPAPAPLSRPGRTTTAGPAGRASSEAQGYRQVAPAAFTKAIRQATW